MALEGRFGEHHAMLCRLHLDHLDHLDGMIAELDAQVETMMQPFRAARDLLITIPGLGPLSAAAVISEIGAMSVSSSPTPRTWPPGPACVPATTSPPGSGTPGSAGPATSTCSPSWSRPPGPRSATTGT